jgi:hypothetical protein
MVLAPQLAPIRGIGAGCFASARSADRGAIHESAIPIDLVGGLEFREQNFANALPDPRFLPLPKAAQARVSGRKITGGRKGPPRDARLQDEKDAAKNPPGLTRLSSSELHLAVFLGLGDPRFQAFPKLIGQKRLGPEEDLLLRSSSKPADGVPNER